MGGEAFVFAAAGALPGAPLFAGRAALGAGLFVWQKALDEPAASSITARILFDIQSTSAKLEGYSRRLP